MGEPESDSGHHEHAVIGDVGGISSPNAGDTMKEGQPQLDSTHEQQLEHYEADDITRMHLEPTGSMGEAENGNLAAVETAQHPPHDDQHATQGSAAMHVDDGKEEGSELPAEVINHENHPASQDSQEQGHSSATWLSTAADSASSQDTLQPVSEETSLHRKPTPDEGHHLSYNGGSSVADSMQHTAAVPDQTHDEPVASGVAKSKQAQQPKAEDSQAMPEDQAKYLQEEDAREGEVVDQEPTSTPADTNTAIPGGIASEGEAGVGNDDEEEDDDWGDDFGGFEEAAEVAEEQPSTQAAKPVAAPPAPEAPSEDAEVSEMAQLFSASHEELLQLVSRQLLGPGHLTNGELHNISSTALDDSLQGLAEQLLSLSPGASELTQRALQIGTRHKGAQRVEPIAWAGSDTEAAFLSSLPLRKRASEQGENGDSGASGGPAHKPERDINVSSMSGKHGEEQGTCAAPAQIRVGMRSIGEKVDSGDNAALRALVKKLPDLSYMLSDSLVVPTRTR